MSSRPGTLVGVLGTATEIGKTWVAAQVLADLAATGRSVAARKPVQSFDPDDPAPTDAETLAAATGEDPGEVCPDHRSLPVPMAPPMAADALGRPRPLLAELLAEVTWPTGVELGLLETVGGAASPIAADAHSAGFLAAVEPDVVLLVADAGLGTIDAVRTALAVVTTTAPVLVFLNRFDEVVDLHRRNLAWLTDEDRADVETSVSNLARRLTTLLG